MLRRPKRYLLQQGCGLDDADCCAGMVQALGMVMLRLATAGAVESVAGFSNAIGRAVQHGNHNRQIALPEQVELSHAVARIPNLLHMKHVPLLSLCVGFAPHPPPALKTRKQASKQASKQRQRCFAVTSCHAPYRVLVEAQGVGEESGIVSLPHRRMLNSFSLRSPTPQPAKRLATRTSAAADLAPVSPFSTAGTSLPTSGKGFYVEYYQQVYTSLRIPVSSQHAPRAVSPALNYTQAYYNSRQPPPLFHLANNSSQFTLLFAGAHAVRSLTPTLQVMLRGFMWRMLRRSPVAVYCGDHSLSELPDFSLRPRRCASAAPQHALPMPDISFKACVCSCSARCAGYLFIAKAATYQFSVDLGHATLLYMVPGARTPNDGAIMAIDGSNLIAVNGAVPSRRADGQLESRTGRSAIHREGDDVPKARSPADSSN